MHYQPNMKIITVKALQHVSHNTNIKNYHNVNNKSMFKHKLSDVPKPAATAPSIPISCDRSAGMVR